MVSFVLQTVNKKKEAPKELPGLRTAWHLQTPGFAGLEMLSRLYAFAAT